MDPDSLNQVLPLLLKKQTKIQPSAWGLILCVLFFGCSSDLDSRSDLDLHSTEGSESLEIALEAEGSPPQIESLRVEPRRPTSEQLIRAVAKLRGASSDLVSFDYEWRLNGQKVRARTDAVKFPSAQKGDRFEVIAIATDSAGRKSQATAFGRIGNRPPVVLDLELLTGSETRPGDIVNTKVRAHDPDGDDLRMIYEWRVNGRRVSDGDSSYDTADLRRGDLIQVTVNVDDGDDHSERRVSNEVEIANSPPQIVSDPGKASIGSSFFYQLRATDSDYDRALTYTVVEGPMGMEIDRLGGELTWMPGPSQGGVHRVMVQVEDRHGGAASQSFDITITDEAEPRDLAGIQLQP
ncbi:MAG: hypothetical protein CL917_11015 [Deltaproteobacteria bacterium]|nr:hypothetical protein [Deltaproteobacteria bacterium]